MAAGDLVDLTSVKAFLKVTTTNDDTLLGKIVSDVSAYIPNVIQRGVLTATYAEVYRGNGKDRQMVRNNPIQSVASVQWQGTVLTATGDPFAGTPGFWFEDKHVWLQGYCFPLGDPVKITYTAGWATAPADIQEACIEVCAEIYRRREHIGESSHSQGGQTTVSYDMRMYHALISQRLQNYTRVAPV